MQLCRISLLFLYFLAVLHASSNVIAHNQEHLNCSYSSHTDLTTVGHHMCL
jgi:hypothetical protein